MKNILILALVAGMLQSCGNRRQEISPARENIIESVYASGIVKAKDQYEVYSPVSGLIEKIFVSKGDLVNKGDAIFRVRSETSRLNIDNSRLTLDNAAVGMNADRMNELRSNIVALKNRMQNDSLLMERQRNLWAQEIGTRNELEQRELAYRNDRMAYDAAVYHFRDFERELRYTEAISKNNLQMSKLLADDFTVKSKIGGRVFNIIKEEGELVTGQTAVAVIGAATDFLLELQVDEYDISRVKSGQKILISMDSYKSRVFEAVVTKIIPMMNDRTRSFTIEAIFTKVPPALFPNLTVEANIIILSKENVLTIPRDFMINDSLVLLAPNKTRKVVTGLRDYQKVEIVNGLTESDKIVKPVR